MPSVGSIDLFCISFSFVSFVLFVVQAFHDICVHLWTHKLYAASRKREMSSSSSAAFGLTSQNLGSIRR